MATLGGNVNGPSLIRCPRWINPAPAKYLLYFAHHEGRSIRLALSDRLQGPWRLHQPSPLRLEDSFFPTCPPALADLHPQVRADVLSGTDGNYAHIASPDAWIDENNRQVRLYYHGRLDDGRQASRVAISSNGVDFTARPEVLNGPYSRLFRHRDEFYAISMPAQLYRSPDGLSHFEAGPCLTAEPIRHHALLHYHDRWFIFWTRVGDEPERILVSRLHTEGNWRDWYMGDATEIHRAQTDWEGGKLAPEASRYGEIMRPVNQLRDPAIFQEAGRIYLLYAIAGEQGIAIGELLPTPAACD